MPSTYTESIFDGFEILPNGDVVIMTHDGERYAHETLITRQAIAGIAEASAARAPLTRTTHGP